MTDANVLPLSPPTPMSSQMKARVDADEAALEAKAVIAELAMLDPLAYDRCRIAEAEKLGVRVSTLDAEVDKARPKPEGAEGQGGTMDIPDIEPWPHPVDGDELIEELAATFRRYAVLPKHADVVLAPWIVMTYLLDAITIAPAVAITSPEKSCGKTTVLDIISRLARRPLAASNISPAALFRSIEKWGPTLLIDEADTFAVKNDELRGVINSGHTRQTAFVVRCVGDDSEPRLFSTWGCKALAAIGKLPDTVMDRSIEVRLRRALPGEVSEKIRHANPAHFDRLSRQAARWASDNAGAVRLAHPEIPAGLSNRTGDNAEPLLAIADLAGGKWGETVRKALTELAGMNADDTPVGVTLLRDTLAAFDRRGVARMPTKTLIDELVADELTPWPSFDHGKPITARQLARRLAAFGVKPGKWRDDAEKYIRGYVRADLIDPVARYVTPLDAPENAATSATSATSATKAEIVADVALVADVADVLGATKGNAYARASRGE